MGIKEDSKIHDILRISIKAFCQLSFLQANLDFWRRSPLFWWLTVGQMVEYCFLILVDFVKAISPWATYILLLGFGSITHMGLMCLHYGFNVKYFWVFAYNQWCACF